MTADFERDTAIDAWLGAIAIEGWRDATLERAATVSGLTRTMLIERVGDQLDAVSAFLDRVAREAALGTTGGSNVRERLFDGIMRGMDMLQAHRSAVLAIAEARDPQVVVLAVSALAPGVRRIAAVAGAGTSGLRGQLRLVALGGLVARLFDVWRRDDSADMSATMAELDRLLDRAERAETEGLSFSLLGLPGLGSFGRNVSPSVAAPVALPGPEAAKDR